MLGVVVGSQATLAPDCLFEQLLNAVQRERLEMFVCFVCRPGFHERVGLDVPDDADAGERPTGEHEIPTERRPQVAGVLDFHGDGVGVTVGPFIRRGTAVNGEVAAERMVGDLVVILYGVRVGIRHC